MASAENYKVFDRLDHLGPGPDHLGPGPDHLGPGPDHLGPGPEHLGPGPDHLGPGPDHLGPGPEHLGPGPDRLGSGPDHLGPGLDATKPISAELWVAFSDENESLAAQLQVSSSEEEEDEGPGDSEEQQTGDVAGQYILRTMDGPDLGTGPDSTISASAEVSFTDGNASLAAQLHLTSSDEEVENKTEEYAFHFERSHLKRHMRTHTRVKPFSCHGSRRSFSARKYVKRKQVDSGEEARSRVQKTEEAQTWLDAAERYILSVLDGTDVPISASAQVPFTDGNASLAAQLHLTSSDEEEEKKTKEYAFHCDKSKQNCDISGEGHRPKSSLCDTKQTCGQEVSQRALTGESDLKIQKGKKVFFCEICKKNFKSNYYLKSHKITHSGERPYSCDSCKRRFSQRSHLKRHMQTHTREKHLPCHGSGRSLSARKYVKRKRKDSGEEARSRVQNTEKAQTWLNATDLPISASTQVPFTDGNASLAAQLHLTSSDEEEEKKREEYAFHCDKSKQSCDISREGHRPESSLCDTKQTCGQEVSQRALTGESDLKIQKGKKVFFCEICKKDFKSNYYLKSHKITHSGERPHSCDSCKRRFSQRSHLKRHMQTHTREKPFPCHGSGRSLSARKYVKRKRKDSGEEARSRVQNTEEAQTWLNATDLPISASAQVPFTDGNASLAAQLHLTSSDEEEEKKTEEYAFHCDKSKQSCDISREGHRPESSLCDTKQTCGQEVSQRALTGESDLKIQKGKKVFFCEICKKDFKSNYCLKSHKITHCGERPYSCDSCNRRFSQRSDLKRHMQTHTREKPLPCHGSGRSLSARKYVKRKRKDSGEEARSRVQNTEKAQTWLNATDLPISASTQVPFTDGNASLAAQLHLTSSNEEEEKKTEEYAFHCDKSKQSCDISREGHRPESSLCDTKQTCGQEVSQRALTGESDLKIQKGKKVFFCEICKKDFKSNYYLKSHKITHSGERPHSCDSCKRRFSQRSHLKRHMQTHTREKPFPCHGSGRSLSARKYVKRKRKDSGEEARSRVQNTEEAQTWLNATDLPISASAQVPFTYGNASLAAQLQLTSRDEEEKKKTEEYAFHCNKSKQSCDISGEGHGSESSVCDTKQTCGQEVSQRALTGDSDLKIQKGKKVFFCEICKKDLKSNYYLKRHKITHSGEKLYSCDSCKRRFSQRSHLKRHMQTHTREKPFSCHGSGRSLSARKYVKREQVDSGEEARSRVQKTEEAQTWLDATDLPISAPFTDGNESLAQLQLTSSNEEDEKETEESAFHCDKSKEVKHCCDMTGEGHRHESSLRFHKQTCWEVSQRALTGDSHLKILKRKRVFFCEICKKDFNSHLQRHKMTHSGERPYTCDICQRSFRRKSKLKGHMQFHSRKKPNKKPVEDPSPLMKE